VLAPDGGVLPDGPADCQGLTGPEALACLRAEYVESKLDRATCHQRTYLCQSANGAAALGARFIALAEAFGERGRFYNVCDPAGVPGALHAFAEHLAQVVGRDL
jgi:hypothetical protein